MLRLSNRSSKGTVNPELAGFQELIFQQSNSPTVVHRASLVQDNSQIRLGVCRQQFQIQQNIGNIGSVYRQQFQIQQNIGN